MSEVSRLSSTPMRATGIWSAMTVGLKPLHNSTSTNDLLPVPVFFIQDAIKFPDIIHAVKPEPHNEVPQGQSAHNNFWDFVGLQPESAHMVMWAMSDRGIPRSFRMMQGFGVNTYTLVNAEGERFFVKFHWLPELGVHSLIWDEALKIAGQDPGKLSSMRMCLRSW